jgi:hypothetical protein
MVALVVQEEPTVAVMVEMAQAKVSEEMVEAEAHTLTRTGLVYTR